MSPTIVISIYFEKTPNLTRVLNNISVAENSDGPFLVFIGSFRVNFVKRKSRLKISYNPW